MVLNTLVVDIESETLLNKERKPKSLRGLVAGAAAASFLLGLVAATAISADRAVRQPNAALHKSDAVRSAIPNPASPALHTPSSYLLLSIGEVTATPFRV